MSFETVGINNPFSPNLFVHKLLKREIGDVEPATSVSGEKNAKRRRKKKNQKRKKKRLDYFDEGSGILMSSTLSDNGSGLIDDEVVHSKIYKRTMAAVSTTVKQLTTSLRETVQEPTTIETTQGNDIGSKIQKGFSDIEKKTADIIKNTKKGVTQLVGRLVSAPVT